MKSLILKISFLVVFICCFSCYSTTEKNSLNVAENLEGRMITYTMINTDDKVAKRFLDLLLNRDNSIVNKAFKEIDEQWEEGHEIMLIEAMYFVRDIEKSKKMLALLEEKTKQKFGYDLDSWFQWVWNKTPKYPDVYFKFKADLHELIDPRFKMYFENRASQSLIRLDEVRWGGVEQDGIPPLRQPEMIAAEDANYLNDTDVVFGIEVNGDVRAYPKRILAWHEMFVDTVGNTPVAGVYCTLCGTVILYKTEHNGTNHNIGTSGFLYRSNKLMYDKATQSLWSTLDGSPVIGPLVDKNIKLDYLSVVTTTWGAWKNRHPNTLVLALNTGYQRDYGEGVAYKDYFSTDDLMFTVPELDTRLKNKDEILALRHSDFPSVNIAISSNFLKENPVYHTTFGTLDIVILTDNSGAHRAFITGGLKFKALADTNSVVDEENILWTINETHLTNEAGATKTRFHTHNAFWFGYKAAYPEVKLIK